MHFADFWEKNNVLAQNDRGFKKILTAKKVHNLIVSKIARFAEIIVYVGKIKNKK